LFLPSIIQWAFDRHSPALEHMGVDHSGTDILVAEQFLDGANVAAVLEEVGGEGVSEGVATDAFFDACFLSSHFDRALQAG